LGPRAGLDILEMGKKYLILTRIQTQNCPVTIQTTSAPLLTTKINIFILIINKIKFITERWEFPWN
jgi:hypothetical protein